MSRIDDTFADLRSRGRKALIPFVCGGHPRPGSTAELLRVMERAGSRIVEVGIPFSDPIADGPVIAAAMSESLAGGTTPRSILDEVAAVRSSLDIALVAMVSFTIVHRWKGGPHGFISDAASAGFDGFLVPDAPLEESGPLIDAAKSADRSLALMVAPTTPPERAKAIASAASGFVYLLARTGITGESAKIPDIAPAVRALREHTQLPIAAGFGISTPEHVRAVVGSSAGNADAAIVGSALVRRISDAARANQDHMVTVESFARSLVGGLA